MPFIENARGRIEYERIEPERAPRSIIVMLHEALGSVAMWKDFPLRLARATQCSVVAYSRHGHGRSAPLPGPRPLRYLHDEAFVILPPLLDELGIERPVLFGHSDGASIALLHAGGTDREVAGVVALAPHVLVEEISIAGITAAKLAYETTALRQRLDRYHDSADALFLAWHGIWLDPDFRGWNIEEYLPRIACPVLAIQGEDDQYGTMDQIHRIAAAAPDVELLALSGCGHSPHRDRPDAVLAAVTRWMTRIPLPGPAPCHPATDSPA